MKKNRKKLKKNRKKSKKIEKKSKKNRKKIEKKSKKNRKKNRKKSKKKQDSTTKTTNKTFHPTRDLRFENFSLDADIWQLLGLVFEKTGTAAGYLGIGWKSRWKCDESKGTKMQKSQIKCTKICKKNENFIIFLCI